MNTRQGRLWKGTQSESDVVRPWFGFITGRCRIQRLRPNCCSALLSSGVCMGVQPRSLCTDGSLALVWRAPGCGCALRTFFVVTATWRDRGYGRCGSVSCVCREQPHKGTLDATDILIPNHIACRYSGDCNPPRSPKPSWLRGGLFAAFVLLHTSSRRSRTLNRVPRRACAGPSAPRLSRRAPAPLTLISARPCDHRRLATAVDESNAPYAATQHRCEHETLS